MIEEIRTQLKQVIDPELHHSIIDLGLVYDIAYNQETKATDITMTLTSPTCPYAGMIIHMTRTAAKNVQGVESAEVTITFEPMWEPKKMMSDDIKLELGIF